MSYDPTQQVPPPQGYPPQQGYPPSQPYPSQPQPPATYAQYSGGPAPAGAGFDFNAFWRNLGLTGQVCLIGGIVLFISFLIPWYGISETCSGSGCGSITSVSYSWNAFSIIGNVAPNGDTSSGTYSFPLVLVIILASLVLIVAPIVGAMGKLAAKQTQLAILGAGGLSLLLEIIVTIQKGYAVRASALPTMFGAC